MDLPHAPAPWTCPRDLPGWQPHRRRVDGHGRTCAGELRRQHTRTRPRLASANAYAVPASHCARSPVCDPPDCDPYWHAMRRDLGFGCRARGWPQGMSRRRCWQGPACARRSSLQRGFAAEPARSPNPGIEARWSDARVASPGLAPQKLARGCGQAALAGKRGICYRRGDRERAAATCRALPALTGVSSPKEP